MAAPSGRGVGSPTSSEPDECTALISPSDGDALGKLRRRSRSEGHEADAAVPAPAVLAALAVAGGLAAHVAAGSLAALALACVLAALLAAMAPTRVGPLHFNILSASTLAVGLLFALGGRDTSLVALVGAKGSPIAPYHSLVMFFSSAYLCISLERTGLLRVVATSMVSVLSGAPRVLFVTVTLVSGALSMLIPDDIVTMAMAPALCEATQRFGLEPAPFIFAQFYAANSLSIALVTGNPTNVLAAEALVVLDSAGNRRPLTFWEFAAFCACPAVLGLITCAGAVCALTPPAVAATAAPGAGGLPPQRPEDAEAAPHGRGSGDGDPSGGGLAAPVGTAGFAAARLLVGLVLCALDAHTGIPAWVVVFVVAVVSLAADLLLDVFLQTRRALSVLEEMPWELLPFLVALFLAVECLSREGAHSIVAPFIETSSEQVTIVYVGLVTILVSQMLSAIPSSLLLLRVVLSVKSWSPQTRCGALLALVVGSNLGGIGTPVGSLGSQMLLHITRDKGCDITPCQFSQSGLPSMILATLVATGALALTFQPIAGWLGVEFV